MSPCTAQRWALGCKSQASAGLDFLRLLVLTGAVEPEPSSGAQGPSPEGTINVFTGQRQVITGIAAACRADPSVHGEV